MISILFFTAKGGVIEENDIEIEVVADLTTDEDSGSNDWDSGAWDNDSGDNSGAWDNDTGDSVDIEDNFICTGQGSYRSTDRCDVFYTCTSDGKVIS